MISLPTPLPDANGDGVVVIGKDWAKRLGLKVGDRLRHVAGSVADYLVNDETSEPAPWVCLAPRPPRVTTAPVDRGPNGYQGWGDASLAADFHFTKAGHVTRPTQPRQALTIRDGIVDNCSSLFTQENGAASVGLLTIERVRAVTGERGIFARGSTKVAIVDVHLRKAAPGRQTDYPEGIMLGAKVSPGNDTVSGYMERVLIEDYATVGKAGSYQQGDDVMVEAGDGPFHFKHVRAIGATDAGFDCKASNVTFEECEFEGNHENLKLWGSNVVVNRARSIRPSPHVGSGAARCHVWFAGDTTRTYVFNEVEFIDDGDVKHFAKTGAGIVTVVLNNCTLNGKPLRVEDLVLQGAKGLRFQ